MRAILTGVILAAVILACAYCYGQEQPVVSGVPSVACPNGACQVPQRQPNELAYYRFRRAPIAIWWRRETQVYRNGATVERFTGPFGGRYEQRRGPR